MVHAERFATEKRDREAAKPLFGENERCSEQAERRSEAESEVESEAESVHHGVERVCVCVCACVSRGESERSG